MPRNKVSAYKQSKTALLIEIEKAFLNRHKNIPGSTIQTYSAQLQQNRENRCGLFIYHTTRKTSKPTHIQWRG
jgi:hypothetical protein